MNIREFRTSLNLSIPKFTLLLRELTGHTVSVYHLREIEVGNRKLVGELKNSISQLQKKQDEIKSWIQREA